jgi:hypothetical protein
MKTTATFTINDENNIIAHPTPDHAEAAIGAGAQSFSTEKQLAKVTAEWPMSRLVETWNAFAGTPGFDKLKEVKKFKDRQTAVDRIWRAIEVLAPATDASPAPEAAPVAPEQPEPTTKATRAKKAPKAPKAPAAERIGTKKAAVLQMMARKNGASNKEIQEAMNWQPHTVRGFVAGTLKKAGIATESFKRENGDRAYRTV